MSNELKKTLELTGNLIESIPKIIEESMDKFDNEKIDKNLINKFVNFKISGKEEEANKILKMLQNGE
jgi:hypothetical protein